MFVILPNILQISSLPAYELCSEIELMLAQVKRVNSQEENSNKLTPIMILCYSNRVEYCDDVADI